MALLERTHSESRGSLWRSHAAKGKRDAPVAYHTRNKHQERISDWKKDDIKKKWSSSTCDVIAIDKPHRKAGPDVHSVDDEFNFHAFQWRRETKHVSSLSKMVLHPSYLRIIGMGRPALPLLLRELEKNRGHWLVALNAIEGKDHAPPGSTFNQAVDAWISWGRQQGYLTSDSAPR